MVAIPVLAKDLVEQVGCTINHQVMVGKLERGIDATEYLDHAQAVQRAMLGMDGRQDLLGTLAGRGVSLLHLKIITEFSLDVAGMPRRDQQVAGPDTEVQVARFLLGEFNALFVRWCLGTDT